MLWRVHGSIWRIPYASPLYETPTKLIAPPACHSGAILSRGWFWDSDLTNWIRAGTKRGRPKMARPTPCA